MLDRAEVNQALKTYICELGKMPNYPLQDDESLVDSGLLDSFALVEVSVFVDTQFGVDIPDEAVNIDDMATLAQIVDAVLYWEQHQSDAELS